MKKKYVDPEVEIVLIDEADIIFSSGTVCPSDTDICKSDVCGSDCAEI